MTMVAPYQRKSDSTDGGLHLDLPPRGLSMASYRQGQPGGHISHATARPESSSAAATRAGGLKDLESPMAAYFGESCRSEKPAWSEASDTQGQHLAEQSPMEAYFNGFSSVSFNLDGTPYSQETPTVCASYPLPGSGGATFPHAWSLPPQSRSHPFSLPTLLQSSQPKQNRFCRPSKLSARSRSGAETMRAKPVALVKRGVTAPVISRTDVRDVQVCPTPNVAPGRSVAGHVWNLSQDALGCREVQDAIEAAVGEEARVGLAMELSGHVWEALQCPHANHVVRKFINTMSASSLQFVIDELVREGGDVVREAARHRYGCRIVEALLKTCTVDQVHEMVQHLLPDTADLSVRMYGNFVVQRLLEHGTDSQRHYVNEVLRASVTATASNFYGSAVVGAALKHGEHEDRISLAHAIVEVNGLLGAILRFRHGQSIKDQLLEILETSEKATLAQEQLQAPPMRAPRSDRTFVDYKGRSSRAAGVAEA